MKKFAGKYMITFRREFMLYAAAVTSYSLRSVDAKGEKMDIRQPLVKVTRTYNTRLNHLSVIIEDYLLGLSSVLTLLSSINFNIIESVGYFFILIVLKI